MAKKRRNQNNNSNRGPAPVKPALSQNQKLDDVQLELAIKAEEVLKPGDLAELEQVPESKEFKVEMEKNDLEKSWHHLKNLWKRAETKLAQYEKQLEELKKDREELDAEREAYKDLQKRRMEVAKREGMVSQKEAEADAGFPEILEIKRQELQGKIDALELERKSLQEAKKGLDQKMKDFQAELEARYDKRIEQIQQDTFERAEQLEEEKRILNKRERALNAIEGILVEEREDFEEAKQSYIDTRIEQADLKIQSLEESKSWLVDLIKEKETEIIRLEALFHKFGNRKPEEVQAELDGLKKENKKLRKESDSKLAASEKTKLEELEKQNTALEEQNLELLSQKMQFESKYNKVSIGVAELDDLREHINALEGRLQLKQQIMEELQAEVDDYTKKVEGKVTFEFCKGMDEEQALQKPGKNTEAFEDLIELSHYLRHQIAGVEENPLYYSESIIRTFLGGLAIGQLTLLQGISGTGKTSLPRAFAKAISGKKTDPFEVIEVQSGWRDRQDLLGFFNTFENKYYESNFLKALYKASTPLYRGLPFFIILDEMNLSHPEHYFADLLSQMENDPKDRKLEIIAATKQIPQQMEMRSNGLFLPLPPNVWFIGTANHDETTLQFAPKTYDRANVMEMPIHPDRFKPEKQNPRVLTFENLNELFHQAQTENGHIFEVKKAQKILDESVKPLVQKLGIGWGNRLEKQLAKFLPVVISAGGSMEEALDHIIASKVFRSLRNRYDIRKEQYVTLRDKFGKIFPGEAPSSMAILNKELNRLGEESE
jgi:hypothetical protein